MVGKDDDFNPEEKKQNRQRSRSSRAFSTAKLLKARLSRKPKLDKSLEQREKAQKARDKAQEKVDLYNENKRIEMLNELEGQLKKLKSSVPGLEDLEGKLINALRERWKLKESANAAVVKSHVNNINQLEKEIESIKTQNIFALEKKIESLASVTGEYKRLADSSFKQSQNLLKANNALTKANAAVEKEYQKEKGKIEKQAKKETKVQEKIEKKMEKEERILREKLELAQNKLNNLNECILLATQAGDLFTSLAEAKKIPLNEIREFNEAKRKRAHEAIGKLFTLAENHLNEKEFKELKENSLIIDQLKNEDIPQQQAFNACKELQDLLNQRLKTQEVIVKEAAKNLKTQQTIAQLQNREKHDKRSKKVTKFSGLLNEAIQAKKGAAEEKENIAKRKEADLLNLDIKTGKTPPTRPGGN